MIRICADTVWCLILGNSKMKNLSPIIGSIACKQNMVSGSHIHTQLNLNCLISSSDQFL